MLDLTHKYTCPYCGSTDNLSNFLIIKKDGSYNTYYALCPICEEKMRLKTLLASMSLFEWGLWIYLNIRIYNSPNFKFYDKVHFEPLYTNLSLMGQLYKREFQKGFYHGKEIMNNEGFEKGKQLLDELNKKYNIIFSGKKQYGLTAYI